VLNILDATPLRGAYSWGCLRYKSKTTRWGICSHIKAVINDREYWQRTWLIRTALIGTIMIEAGWNLNGMNSDRFSDAVGKFIGIRVAIL